MKYSQLFFFGLLSLEGKRGGLDIKSGFYSTTLPYMDNGGDTPLHGATKTWKLQFTVSNCSQKENIASAALTTKVHARYFLAECSS